MMHISISGPFNIDQISNYIKISKVMAFVSVNMRIIFAVTGFDNLRLQWQNL